MYCTRGPTADRYSLRNTTSSTPGSHCSQSRSNLCTLFLLIGEDHGRGNHVITDRERLAEHRLSESRDVDDGDYHGDLAGLGLGRFLSNRISLATRS